MYAAFLFNQKREKDIATIYGCVTSGTNWRFLRFKNKIAELDSDEYLIDDANKILGILMDIIK
jgi:hypothetical protein